MRCTCMFMTSVHLNFACVFQITYGGASPLLSDRERYPRMFKLEAPDSRFNLARIELARQFNWKKVATLNVALDYFSAVSTISYSDKLISNFGDHCIRNVYRRILYRCKRSRKTRFLTVYRTIYLTKKKFLNIHLQFCFK